MDGNLDDFKVFRGNSSQGISPVQDAAIVKKKTKAVENYRSAIKTLPHRIQVKVSEVFSSYVLFS